MRHSFKFNAHGMARWAGLSGRLWLPVLLACMSGVAMAQASTPSQAPQQAPADAAAAATEASTATASYFNRDIVTFRSSFLGMTPTARAQATEANITRAVDLPGVAKMGYRIEPQGVVILLAGRPVLIFTYADLDPLGGETLEQARTEIEARLGAAVHAAESEQGPRQLLHSVLLALLATAILAALLWSLRWLATHAQTWINRRIEAFLSRSRAMPTKLLVRGLVSSGRGLMLVLQWSVVLALLEEWLRYVLSRFAYTQPWAEAMTDWIAGTLAGWGHPLLSAAPGLLTVVVIFLLARVVTKTIGLLLAGVQRGRYNLLGIDAQLAEPTRKLIVAAVWLFALAMAYPSLPGANTDAFKGLSVLVGLMVSLGASSIIGQAACGFTLLYSRTMQPGDYVRIDDTDGIVQKIGLFTTRLRTFTGVEVSFPNTVVLGGRLENYSRNPEAPGFWLETGVTIGYDTPWRQVHRLLIKAAEATDGVEAEPAPYVLQTALSDFYAEYRLRARIVDPLRRNPILTELHGNIQDAFNTAGVQIMSPNYRADTGQAKIVPHELWEGLPAPPEPKASKASKANKTRDT